MATTHDLYKVKKALIQEACVISLDGFLIFANEGVDLGLTTELEDASLDLVGVVEKTISGEELTVSFTVPENTMDILTELYPWTPIEASDGDLGVITPKYVTDFAKQMIITPWSERQYASEGTYLTIFKAAPEGDLSQSFSKTDIWGYTVTFRAYPDLSRSDGSLLAEYNLNSRVELDEYGEIVEYS